MPRRSAHQLEPADVSRLVGAIYDAALSPALWSGFMSEALSLFDANQGTVILVAEDNPSATIIETPGFNPEYLPEFYARRESEDYWWLAGRTKPTGTAFVGTDLISIRDMRRRALYHEVARLLDAEFLVGGVVDKHPGLSAYFSLVRSKRQDNFTAKDKAIIRILLPHLRRALFIHRQFAAADQWRATYEAALNHLSHGVVICDAQGKLIFANRLAESIFRAQDGLALQHSRMKATNPSENILLQAMLAQSAKTSSGGGLCAGGIAAASRPSGKRPYQVLVSPLNRCSENARIMTNASTIVFVCDTDESPQPTAETLAVMFKLTKAEVGVCQALASGLATDDIAVALHVSVNTIKTHLKSIFRKAGTGTKAELLQILALHLAWKSLGP